jgi:hypothetical protein
VAEQHSSQRLGTLSASPDRVPSTLAPVVRPLLAVVALTASTACSSRPDPDEVLATVRSWTATTQLALEERRAGATTATYTRQLRDRAAKALDAARLTLAEAAATSDDRSHARPALDSLSLAIRALDEAARR